MPTAQAKNVKFGRSKNDGLILMIVKANDSVAYLDIENDQFTYPK